MDERTLQIQACMYQYSRAIYRSIKDLVDPYVTPETRAQYRREVLDACEQTMERLAADPHYFAKPDRALFQDIRRYFPITCQAQVAWAVREGATDPKQIVAKVYTDVSPKAYAMAERAVLAHLEKLCEDGLVLVDNEIWAPT